MSLNRNRVFVFTLPLARGETRNRVIAIPEQHITILETCIGSQNCYLKVNGIETTSSFTELVNLMGERHDVK